MANPLQVKHRQVYNHLRQRILEGVYSIGDRVPTEAQLQQEFSASRVTVARAVRDLAREGFVVRRRGTGSFVQDRPGVGKGLVSFMLLNELTGIFPPICQAASRELETSGHHITISSFVYTGDTKATLARVEESCRSFKARGVQGVLFAPFEAQPADMWMNERITELLAESGVPIVLIDRDICTCPRRSRFDLVSMANRRCTSLLTRHLLSLGRRRIAFVGPNYSTSVIAARVGGFNEALAEHGLVPESLHQFAWEYGRRPDMSASLRTSKADAYVCVNDHMAAQVMSELIRLGIRVPEDVAVVGIDDVDYAALVPVPLTTMRQPLCEIGRVAARLLLDRVADASLPPREVLLDGEMIVRESCGAVESTASVRRRIVTS